MWCKMGRVRTAGIDSEPAMWRPGRALASTHTGLDRGGGVVLVVSCFCSLAVWLIVYAGSWATTTRQQHSKATTPPCPCYRLDVSLG